MNGDDLFILNKHVGNDHFIQIVETRSLRQDDSLFKDVKALLPSGLSPFNMRDTYYSMSAMRTYDENGVPQLTGVISCWYGRIEFSELNRYRNNTPSHDEFVSILSGSHFLHSVDFKLRLCGECFFGNYEQSPKLVHNISDEDFMRDVISQAYMFLRDMAHRHKHHHYSEDTFIDTKKNEDGWHRKIAFDLARQAIKKPLPKVPSSYDDALGIISYLRTFQHSYADKLPEEIVYSENSIDAWEKSIRGEGDKSSKNYALKLYLGGLKLGIAYLFTGLSVKLDDGINFFELLILFVVSLLTLHTAQEARLRPREQKYFQFEFAKIYTRGNLNRLFGLICFIGAAFILILASYLFAL